MHSTEVKPLTFDELLSRCLGELDFARKLLRRFLRDSGPTLDEIEASVNEQAFEVAAKAAHRLKGTASLLAAKPLTSCLSQMEQELRSEQAPQIKDMQQLVSKAKQQLEHVKVYAENQLL